MTQKLFYLLKRYADIIIQTWVDDVYADRRMELARRLTFEQLIDPLPDTVDEIAFIVDTAAGEDEITEAARRLRHHAQVRFQQNCLIDEVARELTILRRIVTDILLRETLDADDQRDFKGAIRRANLLFDELILQVIVIYAANLRPPISTRASVWPPPRRRKTDFPEGDE